MPRLCACTFARANAYAPLPVLVPMHLDKCTGTNPLRHAPTSNTRCVRTFTESDSPPICLLCDQHFAICTCQRAATERVPCAPYCNEPVRVPRVCACVCARVHVAVRACARACARAPWCACSWPVPVPVPVPVLVPPATSTWCMSAPAFTTQKSPSQTHMTVLPRR